MMNHTARLIFAALLATAGHVGMLMSTAQASSGSNADSLANVMTFSLGSLPQTKPAVAKQPAVLLAENPLPATQSLAPFTQQKKITEIKAASKPPHTQTKSRAQTQDKRTDSVVAKKDVNLVQEPKFKSLPPAPAYPRQARLRGQQGIVLIHAQLNAQGDVITVRLEKSSGFPLLDKAALNAIHSWDFMPGVNTTDDAGAWVAVPVQFVLTSNKVS